MSDVPTDLTRRRLLAGGAAMSASAALAGCGAFDGEPGDDSAGDNDAESRGNRDAGEEDSIRETQRLHVTQQFEPSHDYDPVVSNDAPSVRILNHLFDGLYEYDDALALRPKLATGDPEVENDGTRYVIEITDRAEFHDGDPVTAEDVLHSFVAPVVERTANAPEYHVIDVESSTTVDETTVQIDLHERYAPFETTTVAVNVVSKQARLDAMDVDEDEWWEADSYPLAGSSYNRDDPIGSGPFQYVDHTAGEFTDVERWDDYWDEPLPELEAVRWVATEDDAARVSRILAGDTDLVSGLPAGSWTDVGANDHVDVYAEPSYSYFYLAYNCNEGPTREAEVRAGIERCFSVAAFVDEIVGPAGVDAVAPVPEPVLEAWDLDSEDYAALKNEYAPQRAADLIGPHLDGTWEPRLIAPPDDRREQLLERVAGGLGALDEYGVEIEPRVRRLRWSEFLDRYHTGDADDYAMYALGWSGGPDPDAYLYPLFHQGNAGVTQGHFYESPGVHDEILAGRETVEADARRDHYDEAITELLENTVHTPAYTLQNSIVAQSHVEDLNVHPSSAHTPRLVSDRHNVHVRQ